MVKLYFDINTKLRKKAKNDFKKDFFTLMNHSVFAKTMGNSRKHRDIKFVTTGKRKNYLVLTNFTLQHRFFFKKSIRNRNEKTQILMNKLFYLGLSLLELSKIVMYE